MLETPRPEKEAILCFLREQKIPFQLFSHPVTDDLEEKKKNDLAAGVTDAVHCKNLVLANRQKTRFFLLTMPYGKRFRTGPVSRQMANGRLNFAEPEILRDVLHTASGKVSPLELIFDKDKRLEFFMDEDLKSAPRLCFHPADDTCTVVLEKEDFFDHFLRDIGVTVGFVTVPAEE